MKKILYLGYFDCPENAAEERNYAPSAVNKMYYIYSAFNRAGWDVTIVSASETKGKRTCKGKTLRLNEKTELRLMTSLGAKNKLFKGLGILLYRLQVFLYLLRHTHKDTPVMVYHSLAYMEMVRFLKKIKKFPLLLEVEEIYGDVSQDLASREREYRLFRCADGFLFPTELLNEKINTAGKKAAVVYGTYRTEERISYPPKDGKIHCVYAGTFDPRKGGAQAAINAARMLPPHYHVHILGFGSPEEKRQVENMVAEVNATGGANVTLDGLLSGREYIRFLQSCHIGLSTQTPDGAFNDTSFPSKVLSYMANGLRVVSARIAVLERSKLNDLISYYEKNTPQQIAEAIMRTEPEGAVDSYGRLNALDVSFVDEIDRLWSV